ncbi:M14 family zinc carboxypeptidase [Aliidiomarina soli]|uniref:Peptidase M14 n=1 Tax=Aliidiomarina soli TaxID=1928574 RepID=A0A432WHF2_9GAMM|nr:M14 family zinc carboxypeptidase [Aliidiomarina soli]RUO33185.1 peptidase M14 [Aliidiomarina soli]
MQRKRIYQALAASILLVFGGVTAADSGVPQWANTEYDETPTVEDVLGYPAASRISSPEQISTYFEALAQAHPERIRLVDYGETWQGRRLFYAVISSPENLANLSQHQASMAALADPRETNQREADDLIAELPGSIWIGASVHGNEISPAESTLVTAWHLLASEHEDTQNLLDNTLIYIDPLQNPDGRARFVSRYYATVGLEHSSDRLSAEQNEPWPNGRTNHYLFDMNRDWFALTQPESRGRVAAFQQARPLYFIDSHEMGGDQSYFFAPSAEPLNPLVTQAQRDGLVALGKNNARRFDEFGFDYFTAEIFDLFYPGYGGNWPNFSGAMASTYEMGSARGHHFLQSSGDILTFADGVQRNFVAFMASIETVAENREQLLQNFYAFRQQGIEQGSQRGQTRSYILPNQRDAAGHRRLAAILSEQGVEVRQTTSSFRACGEQYEAGAYVVGLAQPSHSLVRALLDPEVPLADDFLAEQERRRSNNLRDQIYDVTAWSLPHLFNLDLVACQQVVDVASERVDSERVLPGYIAEGDANYGYVVRWGDMNSARLLTAALREGLRIRSADSAFTHEDGREFAAGSFVLPRQGNPDDLTQLLATLSTQTGAIVEPLANSWIEQGPSIGSGNFKPVQAPNIALLWDEPSSVLSAGSTRYIIEREFHYPVTAIRPAQLRAADLSRYQVLILPASAQPGAYEQALGEQGRENLRGWVARGGVLITLGNATGFAVAGETPLLASALEQKATDAETAEPREGSSVQGTVISDAKTHQSYLRNPQAQPDWVPGIIARTQVDQEHWLTAGVPEQLYTNYIGNEIYTPLRISDGRNLVNFAAPKDLVASGYLWQDNRHQIAYKPYVMVQPHERGLVISFTQEPNLRGYQHGQFVLLWNAIFRGASQATPLR